MALHNAIGRLGEDIAVSFLEGEGYKVLFRNWRPSRGHSEVDVVLQKGNTVVFTEVKTRTSEYFGEPEEFVSPDKVKHLVEASSFFMADKPVDGFVFLRFDVVAIVLTKNTLKLVSYRHITNAFEPSPYFVR